MLKCPDDYDFYAFADQDDIWLDGKIRKATESLSRFGNNVPSLYYCASQKYYSKNEIGGKEFCPELRANSFKAVLYTFATTQGCTMVFNHILLQEIRKMNAGMINMHDSFVYAVCLCLGGRVICDDESFLYYRIHQGQVTGVESVKLGKRISNYNMKRRTRSSICKVILSSDKVIPECAELLKELSEYNTKFKSKIKLLCSKKPDGMSDKEMLAFRTKILTNRF